MAITAKIIEIDNGRRKKLINIGAFAGGQYDFLQCSEEYVAFFSGFGGGKTWAGASKAVLNTLIRFRGHDGLVVAPNYGDLETFVVPEILTRFGELGIKSHYKASSPPFISLWIKTADGLAKQIKIHLRSGAHPESIAGFQVAWSWIDEGCRIIASHNPTKDVKTQCIGRMRGVGLQDKQLFITGTHEGELTWPNQDFITKPKPHHKWFQSSTYDNIYMQDFARGLEEQYDSRLVQQYVHGNAVEIGGVLIYYMFANTNWPAGNIDEKIRLDSRKPLCLSIDFNAFPGIHAIVGQYHPELDEFWFLDELHALGMHVSGMVHEYSERYGKKAVITQIYGDASGHSRDEAVGETAYTWVEGLMRDKGLAFINSTAKSNPLREDRFISANAALKDGKGKRHIKIHPRCKKFIADLRAVKRDEYGRIDKTMEKQGYIHMSDAATYWIHQVRPINRNIVTNFVYSKSRAS